MVDLVDILQKDVPDKRELVGSLSVSEITAELPLIFSTQSESVVFRALDLLKFICESLREPGQSRLLVSTALYAFDCQSADVHARALDLLRRFASPLDSGLANELQDRLEMIDSSQRPAAEALLATAHGAAAKTAMPAYNDTANGAKLDLDDLQAQYDRLDERWRVLAGCPEALAIAAGRRRLLKAINFEATDVVRLDPHGRFQTIKDPDELVDLFMRGFDSQLSEAEIERALDGALRVPVPEDGGDYWEARLTALRARAKNETGYLGTLALAWGFGLDPDPDQYFENLIHKRVNAVAVELAKGNSVSLLATPTHSGLWIDARTLVERARRVGDIDRAASITDQVQALLRVAPEHRDEALVAARDLQGEFASALRYALGCDTENLGANVPLWVAAIRARAPLTEPYCMKVKLTTRSYPEIGKCLHPAAYNSNSAKLLAEYVDNRLATHEMVALIGDMDIGNIKSPLCTEVYWARQFREVSEYRESGNNYWQEDGWEQLFDPDLRIGVMALHVLVYGLAVACPEARTVCQKALSRTILDGRVDGIMLGTVIADHYSDLNTSAWLHGFREISNQSPLHESIAKDTLETVISRGPVPDQEPNAAILDLLLELSRGIESGISHPAARAYLNAIRVGGAASAQARALLEIEPRETSDRIKAAGLLALSERLKRAARWQSWFNSTLTAGGVY